MTTVFYVSYAALWLLLLAMGLLVALLYRHFGLISLGTLEGVQRDGLPVGSVAPVISGVTAAGEDRIWEPKSGRPQLLLFASPDCEPCGAILPEVNRLALMADGAIEITTIVPGDQDDIERLVALFRPPYLSLAEEGSGAADRYRVRVTPFAFVIGRDGRIMAKGLCNELVHLRALLHAAGETEIAARLAPPPQSIRLLQDDPVAANGEDRLAVGALKWSER